MKIDTKATFNEMDAQNRCPEALRVIMAVNKIFAAGVPLPMDQRFVRSTFIVVVRTPSQSIQKLSVFKGIDIVSNGSGWVYNYDSPGYSLTGVESSHDDDKDLLNQYFKNIVKEVWGLVKHLGVPSEANSIYSTRLAGTVAFAQDPSKIEMLE